MQRDASKRNPKPSNKGMAYQEIQSLETKRPKHIQTQTDAEREREGGNEGERERSEEGRRGRERKGGDEETSRCRSAPSPDRSTRSNHFSGSSLMSGTWSTASNPRLCVGG